MASLFLDWRLWALDFVLATITVTASVAKYKLGQSGYQSIRKHYPQVDEEKWETVHRQFTRFGAPLVLISFLPVLTWIILPAAGAFGIRFRSFLIFAFLAKMIRYWILLLIAAGPYRIVT